jgi:hypothetical protein
MGVEKKNERPDPTVDPSSHAAGVWMTEAPGFACVPPRAQSDLGAVRNAAEGAHDDQTTGSHDEQATDPECGTESPQDEVEPRIERYRER